MVDYRSSIEEEVSAQWIEGLAIDEINMEESGIVRMNEYLAPASLLEEASIDFMNQLKDYLELYVAKFNEYRGDKNSGAQIKIFKISNTINDFMLFRNSLRLILCRKSHDIITITLGEKEPQKIIAHIGPFNNISWQYESDYVDIKSLTRHYFSQFVVNSTH